MTSRDDRKLNQISTRVAFLIAGIGFSTLAPLIPGSKFQLHLEDSTLGLLLLCVGLGSIVVMPFAGGLAAKFGCRRIIVISALSLCFSLPFIASALTIPSLIAGLLLMGAGGGTLDVVMNIQAVVVEQESKRPLMSGFHGMFSVGGIVGAGGLTALLSFGISPVVSQLLIAISCAAMLFVVTPNLLPRIAPSDQTKSKTFAFPRGKVLLIGTLCFIVFMGEGSVTDWSGVLLHDYRNVNLNMAGLGYVAFAAMMTLNRLTGDLVVANFGRRKVMFCGSTCAALGFSIAALIPSWLTSVLGFGLVGIGLANVVPILFTATGKQDAMPANLALSSVTTMGYLGLLVGPPLLGFIAHQSSLLVSLGFLATLCVVVAICTPLATIETSNTKPG